MAITLVKVFQGSTTYATDHESNYTSIESEINSLLGVVYSQGVPVGLAQIFDRTGIIGVASYKPVAATLSASLYNMTVAAGAFWTGAEYRAAAASTLVSMASFGTTATHYLNVTTGGVPTVTTTPTSDTAWQFDWNSTTKVVSNVTRYTTCKVLFDGDEYQGMLSTFDQVTDRLAAMDLRVIGALSVAVTTANVTLTATQSRNAVYKTTGTLTGNRDLVVDTATVTSKLLIVHNTCAGAYTLTVKGASGTGIVVPANRVSFLYWDGTNVVDLSAKTRSINETMYDLSYAATTNVDFSNGGIQRVTLTGNVTFALAGAHDGQECKLEVIQDATGSRTATWGAEVVFGTDITGLTLTTTASKRDFITFIYDGVAGKYYPVQFVKGY